MLCRSDRSRSKAERMARDPVRRYSFGCGIMVGDDSGNPVVTVAASGDLKRWASAILGADPHRRRDTLTGAIPAELAALRATKETLRSEERLYGGGTGDPTPPRRSLILRSWNGAKRSCWASVRSSLSRNSGALRFIRRQSRWEECPHSLSADGRGHIAGAAG